MSIQELNYVISGSIGLPSIIILTIKCIYSYTMRKTPLESSEKYYQNGQLKSKNTKFRK